MSSKLKIITREMHFKKDLIYFEFSLISRNETVLPVSRNQDHFTEIPTQNIITGM